MLFSVVVVVVFFYSVLDVCVHLDVMGPCIVQERRRETM